MHIVIKGQQFWRRFSVVLHAQYELLSLHWDDTERVNIQQYASGGEDGGTSTDHLEDDKKGKKKYASNELFA